MHVKVYMYNILLDSLQEKIIADCLIFNLYTENAHVQRFIKISLPQNKPATIILL